MKRKERLMVRTLTWVVYYFHISIFRGVLVERLREREYVLRNNLNYKEFSYQQVIVLMICDEQHHTTQTFLKHCTQIHSFSSIYIYI